MKKLGVSRSTLHRWYDRYLQRGEAGHQDRKPYPGRVWNRFADRVRQAMLEMVFAQPELSPEELAVTFTDERIYFVSKASVYRLLRSHDLRPGFIFMNLPQLDLASRCFRQKRQPAQSGILAHIQDHRE
ncbi:MAG: helix-turn-helix domain-containing protein [Paracoccaceae bacterium]|nr:helix-turn-helix domain-containing protein [Paracoccaceae bacterium]